MALCRHGCHCLFLSSWSVQKVSSESDGVCSVGRNQQKMAGGDGGAGGTGGTMHSPVLNKGTQTRRGSLHWPWLTSQQQPWGYPVSPTRSFSTAKGIFRGGNPTLMSLEDISMQGRHYLCRLSASAAPQSSIQPGWTLPSCAPFCACPPLITTWNSLPWDLILSLLSPGNLVPWTSHQSQHIWSLR